MPPAVEPKSKALPEQEAFAELLRLVQRRDRRAAERVYAAFAADVNSTVRRILGPDTEHDDLVNDILLRVLQNVERVRDPAKLRSWVLSVAINTVRSALRKRTVRRRFLVNTAEPPEAAARAGNPEAAALVRKSFTVLSRLPANERIAFTLRYVDGQSLESVAELCGCSLATAKRRIKRAEQRFFAIAKRDPALAERLASHSRWADE